MGHQRLKKVPRTRRWNGVVELLGDGGSAPEIAGAAARAIEDDLVAAARDPGVTEAVRLLAAVPGAARQADHVRALGGLGISVGASPSLIDLLAGIDRAVDRQARSQRNRNDLGEIAQLALAASLTSTLSPSLPRLLAATPEDVKSALARLDTPERFAGLARTFFAEMMQRSLEYYLARAYAHFIGPGETFGSLGQHDEFRTALGLHCHEAAQVVEPYAVDWFATAKAEGAITRQRAARLAGMALRQLRLELSLRSPSDG
jgi:hypothetical protein